MNPRNISLYDAQEFLWGAKPVAWHLEASYRFGFFGVLIAVPIVAIIKVIVTTLLPFYYRSNAFDPERHLN
ncbi:MAG: hypothetical protein EBZ48_17505 [Proteobacteria bacterium]|nr:hypothetical protein [Pseudomonadota bacterium]